MSENKLSIAFPAGTCTKVCLDFLRFKHSLGQKFEGSYIYCLRYICQQMNQAVGDTPVLSKDTVLNIAQRRDGEAQGTQLNRIRILRQLAEYMVSMDMEAYILPGHFTQKYKYDFRPYIFSREQIADILDAADRMEYSLRSPYIHMVMPAILRVFFGCGLRSSEARQLKLCNVDLTNGVLTVEKSKNLVSRYVPMTESLTAYLQRYADAMGFNFTTNNDAYFFPSPSGGVIHETTLRDRFRAILLQAGVSAPDDGTFPRIHDMRHTFIVYSYARMTGELGLDLYTAMPIIATYVGHTNIKDTERYIHLPEFDYSNITAAGAPFVDACVPEVMFNV
ncbi:tyrosine-type recombinase/integrase [Candidatus Bathyarchaeota archaeon A05DMB-2]|nr:tyrosine-type recombinase/integrase [Candidatus Bathyarchaeota archaeon A05DMB-2]MCR4437373.1 tyrosine-type recombinase/integrase [Eubacteriales bacterium]